MNIFRDDPGSIFVNGGNTPPFGVGAWLIVLCLAAGLWWVVS